MSLGREMGKSPAQGWPHKLVPDQTPFCPCQRKLPI